jgi:hypothetical protein
MAGSRSVRFTPTLSQCPSMSLLSLDIASQGESPLQGRNDMQQSSTAGENLSRINYHLQERRRPSNDYFADFGGDFTDQHRSSESSSPDVHLQDILPAGMTEHRQRNPAQASAVDIWTVVNSVGKIQPPPESEVKRYSRKALPPTPPASAARREEAVAKMVKSVPAYNTSEHMHWEGKRSMTGSIHVVEEEYEEPGEVSVTTDVTETSTPMTWYSRNKRRATFDHKGLVANNLPVTDVGRFYMSYVGPQARQDETQ